MKNNFLRQKKQVKFLRKQIKKSKNLICVNLEKML